MEIQILMVITFTIANSSIKRFKTYMDKEKLQREIQPETIQQIENRARNEAKEIMQPTYIPEIKSGSEPGTAELINVNQKKQGRK